jgi:hypothetical protein
MRYLVTYYTKTGNTRKVAEAIFEALPGDKVMKPLDEVDDLEWFDLIFIGFPVMQFGPPGAVKKFCARRTVKKNIALFITHAIPSESEDPLQQAILAKELERCRSICPGAVVTGFFHCQGEMSGSTAQELLESGIPMLAGFGQMRDITLGHPNQSEIDHATRFAKEMADANADPNDQTAGNS